MPNNRPWHDKTMELVRKHNLSFLFNPGGGQFTRRNNGININIQVSAYDDEDDYKTLLRGLQKLELEKE